MVATQIKHIHVTKATVIAGEGVSYIEKDHKCLVDTITV